MSTPVPPVQTVTPEQRNAYSRYLAAAEALDAAISDPAILEAADLDTKLGDAIDKAIDALHAPAAPLDPEWVKMRDEVQKCQDERDAYDDYESKIL